MSPELFYPENFGLTDSRPTKYSDCYALGMVMYEVLSGRTPFPRYNVCAVVAKVSRGERPGRPRGAEKKWFTDGVWKMVQCCWTPKRDHRPKIEDVLRCLEEASRSWTLLSPRKVADPSTTNSSSRNSSEVNTERSTEDSGVSSPSYMATPEPSPFARQFGGSPILFAHPSSVANDSNTDFSLMVDETITTLDFPEQDQRTFPVSEIPTWISPLIFAKPPLSPHEYATTELFPSTHHLIVPPTDIPVPAIPKQRGGRKSHPQGRTQPTSPHQSDPSLQSQSAKSSTLLSTVVEPPSSSYEYNTDSSTIGPVVPPKPARRPTVVPPKHRGARKSPHRSLPRDYTQPTSPPRRSDSLRTTSGKSLLSTLVEPPTSSYGHDTPLPTPTHKSLALVSTLAEPPSSFHEYDTDSSSSSDFPITPTNVQASAASERQGGMEPLPQGVLRDRTQPTPWQNKLLPQPPGKPLALPPAIVVPSYPGYDTDSSSSAYSPIRPPRPIITSADHAIPNRGGGRKPRRKGFLRNRTISIPWRSPHPRRHNAPVIHPYSYSPPPDPRGFSMDNVAEAVPYGDTRGLSTSRAHRGRFGRTWKNWLRSSLGKLFGNPVTPS